MKFIILLFILLLSIYSCSYIEKTKEQREQKWTQQNEEYCSIFCKSIQSTVFYYERHKINSMNYQVFCTCIDDNNCKILHIFDASNPSNNSTSSINCPQ